VDQFKKSPFVRLSRLSSNDLAKVMSAGSVKRAKILAEKRATTPQHLPLLEKTCNTSLEPVLPGQLKSDHLHKADALVQSVEGKETDSETTIRKMSDVACADEVKTSTAIGPKVRNAHTSRLKSTLEFLDLSMQVGPCCVFVSSCDEANDISSIVGRISVHLN
jgi:hypothetical protein